jgi:hypothetical protein
MKKRALISVLSAMLFVFLTSGVSMAGVYHGHIMKGSVLEVNGDTATICIGTADGAKVGQELTVYKFEKKEKQTETGGGPFDRIKTGKVKITKIFDEHMANAKVLSGTVEANNIVELKK